MTGLRYPMDGFQNSSSYIASGIPYVATNKTGKISFPFVSRSLTICTTAAVTIKFSESASAENTLNIPANTVIELPIRVRDIWVTGDCSILAALTTISRDQYPDMSSWEGI